MGFLGGSHGKESTYNEGDLGSICGMGISPAGGHGNPLLATHSSILAWRIPTYKGAWQAAVHGVAKSWTQLSEQLSTHAH